jgi:SAM-dependent methyltransferase
MDSEGQKAHSLTSKKQIYKQSLALRNQRKLYNLQNKYYDDTFGSSIDRYCEIAFRLKDSKRVLDVGAGSGLLLSLLYELGHECYAIDVNDLPKMYAPEIFSGKKIDFKICNVEVDDMPYPDNYFDAVVCSETLEHFIHSHLNAAKEMHRVMRSGGICIITAPNAVSFRNRSRMLRGKNITWDYEKHYLDAEPVIYRGLSFYPDRHNREFTINELKLLMERAGFKNVNVYLFQSRKYRIGIDRIKSIGSELRDLIPSLRKTLFAVGNKK